MTAMRSFAFLGLLLVLPASALTQTTQYDGLEQQPFQPLSHIRCPDLFHQPRESHG